MLEQKTNEKLKLNKQMQEIKFLESVLQKRSDLAGKLGQSFGGDRDLYKALGYTKTPEFDDYLVLYKRNGVAKRVVNAPVEEAWRKKPLVTEVGKQNSEFEKQWNELVKEQRLWHYLARADRLSGIGQYGILLMGFDDTDDLSKPLKEKKSELIYLRPYSEDAATISKLIDNTSDPRYGMPEQYSIASNKTNNNSRTIHFSRVIHIAENLESNDVYGTPRLEAVLNDIQDLQKIVGGSAEMFWRGAFPGLALSAQADAAMDTMDLDDLEDELQAYIHKLQRYIRLQGIDIKELKPQVSDPSNHFKVLIQSISSATHIPGRILMGTERGELASSQDEINWVKFIEHRCEDFIDPQILRPFIDTMIFTGNLPKVNYSTIWPDLTVATERDKAEVGRINMDTLQKYMSAIGSEFIIPPEIFLKKYLGFTDEEINLAKDLALGEIITEQEDYDSFEEEDSFEEDVDVR